MSQSKNIEEIFDYLPHRYPFLLVDRITELNVGESIRGYKNVTINEPFFTGHFPDHPIMPGVLIVEAMAQVAGVLAMETKQTRPKDGTIYYLAGTDKTRFKRPVVPGDRLDIECKVLVERKTLMKFACRAFVGEELACESVMLCVARQI